MFDRLLAWLGLDLDFALSLHDDAQSAITESLLVGARPRPEGVAAMREVGITHVVSCLDGGELSKVAFLDRDFRTLRLAVRDAIDQDIGRTFPALFDFAARAAERPGGRLLVHCEAGVSRSATLATALLMRSQRLTFLQAFGHLRSKRAGVLPNIGFASQLQRLEDDLRLRPPGGLSSLARYLREVCQVPVEVEVLQEVLERHDHDAPRALRAIFGGDIPRVVQGVRR